MAMTSESPQGLCARCLLSAAARIPSDVRPTGGNAILYSEWAIDFWIGPAFICFVFLALIVFLSTMASDRWAQWRGDILLIAGLIIGTAIVMFVMIYCPPATSHEVFHPGITAADLK
jgi:hypothetical protein